MRTLGAWSIGLLVVCAFAAATACSDEASSPEAELADGGPTTDSSTSSNVVDTGPPDAGDSSVASPPDGFTSVEWTTITSLANLPALPPDPTNKVADNAAAATLGQMLFFDKSYSGALVVGSDGANGGLGAVGDKGKVSCASCHDTSVLSDGRSKPGNVSLGTNFGTRNALAVVNSSFYSWTNWGGRFDSQWSLPPAVAENARIMASTRLEVAHMIWNKYKTEYEAVFGALEPALNPSASDAARFPAAGKPKAAAGDPNGAWEGMTAADQLIVNTIFANYGKAIAAYQRKLVSKNAPFDKYVASDRNAISDAAKRGLRIFIGKGNCIACHSGPTLSDDKFHALAVPQTGANVPAADLGRFTDVAPLLASPFNTSGNFSDDKTTGKLSGLVQDASQRGQFRTPSLRGIALSAPYMHSGQFATLADVITFYSQGGGDPGDAGITRDPAVKAFALAGTDSADLVAFLEALTGEAVASSLRQDTSK